MFQDIPPQSQADITSLAPWLGGVFTLALSNYLTYRITRPKTDSEISKNHAEKKKIDAETDKIHAETIEILNTELTAVLEKAKALRVDVGVLEHDKDELSLVVKRLTVDCAKKHLEILESCEAGRRQILQRVEEIISNYSKVVDALVISQAATPALRIEAVKSLEHLHNLQKTLTKQGLSEGNA